MNKLEQKTSGFTLIEIVVVLIILGVIVVIAFPGLFAQIERHRAQEALNTINAIRNVLETCGVENNYDFSCCNTGTCGVGGPGAWSALSFRDTSNTNGNSGAKFNYSYTGYAPINGQTVGYYDIVATRVGNSNNKVTVSKSSTTGEVSCLGESAYLGFC